MRTPTADKPIVHFAESTPLPDGATGIRETWIKFLQQVLADNPAIVVGNDIPSFNFTRWDGKVLREILRLPLKRGARHDPTAVETRYADMSSGSWQLFDSYCPIRR